MNNNGINPVFVVTLAIVPLISVTQTLNEVAFLALAVGVIYIISASMVSILEKLADRNLIFFVFMVLSSMFATIMAYFYSIFPNTLFEASGVKVYYTAISAGILGLNLLYNNSKNTMSHYFFKLLIQVPCFILMFALFGLIREFLGFGTVWNVKTGLRPIALFATNGGAYLILAIMCGIANAYWLNLSKKRQQYNLLVDKYKLKLNVERNERRVDVVNRSETENYGVSELLVSDEEKSDVINPQEKPKGENNE